LEPNPELRLSHQQMLDLGARVTEIIAERFTGLPDLPVGAAPTPNQLSDLIHEPLPESGDDPGRVLTMAVDRVLRHIVAQDHPRYFATIPSAGNFVAAVADYLASGFNVFSGNWPEGSGPAAVELAAVRWVGEMCGLPAGTGGLFTSGGSMANATALSVARYVKQGERGLARGTVYLTAQSHSCFPRAARLLGMEPDQLRTVPVRDDLTMDVMSLRRLIHADRRDGRVPYCVIANVGTTNTGAIDPLPELARLCAEQDLWLHGDGAFGAAAAIVPEGRRLLAGIDRLDSLSIDPHKWWFQPFEIGGLLVKDMSLLRDTYRLVPDYLADLDADEGEVNFYDYGPQVTRSFRALKLWMSLKTFGADSFRTAVSGALERAERLAWRIAELPEWAVETGPQLATLTFRCRAWDADGQGRADQANQLIAQHLRASNLAILNTTRVRGRLVLRICTINPRTSEKDEETLIKCLRRVAAGLARDGASA
jgi:aromatic-L-amino-acid/L-tryptophan decarboxylase